MLTGLFYPAAFRAVDAVSDSGLVGSGGAGRSAASRGEVDMMKADIEKLLMITEALWQVLKNKHNYTDDDLLGWVQEIDMRDGKLDGRVARMGTAYCPQCNRTLMRSKAVCLYCGEPVKADLFER
jgi:hypothetical protein